MFLEIKRVEMKYNFIVPREYLKTYLKWIEYIPEHWNIEQLLNKKTNQLSNDEIEILKLVKEENKHKEIFKHYLTSNRSMISISNEVHNYIERMPIDKYAITKLPKEELDYSQKVISRCSIDEEIELAISKLKEKKDRDLKEEYILFELNKKSHNLGIQKLNNNIKKTVEENRKEDLHGYEKCINVRNKF